MLPNIILWLLSYVRDLLRARWHQISSSQKTISVLPPEVLCEIFKHLDSRGLLATKLTCKTFYNTTRSRQFWYRLVESCESIRGGSKINESINRLAILDLERWVMRRLRAYESWFSDAPLAFRARQFQCSKVKIGQSKLLPGGRWLLTSTPHGQYFIYDLDSPHTEPQLLFDPGEYNGEDRTRDELTYFSVWVNPVGETLSFRVVVWRRGRLLAGRATRTQIYEATLEEDGRKFLSTGAPLYTSLTYGDNKSRIAISDKYLAEIWTVGNGEGGFRPVLFVCQYMADEGFNSRLEVRADLVTTGVLYHIYMTLNDHIVVAGHNFIEIYTISQFRSLGEQEKLGPLHRLQFPSASSISRLVQPFPYQNFLWAVFVIRGKEIRVMRIPRNASDHPLEVTLGCRSQDWGRLSDPTFISQTATASLHDQTMDVLTYSWDKELTERHFYAHHYQLPSLPEVHWSDFTIEGVDAATGRILLLHDSENSGIILDIE
ncbi:hypothetical protein P691DRAFT_763149 [Macrolepiota fuliginosa MF-IS2]|uniref:F-box domain-containing protein n=1 Tax=Macrolepiota fuliginosa MF-IS2 TaxID=1400762 RepID=A0A9P5X7F0_9AGAR|nr:hypothetical protein P691DRAFT_763149 [Macrolepiota fuliginosa MF-IS2]